jgi:DNA-binding transcriptional regulator YhcF (GntR family)
VTATSQPRHLDVRIAPDGGPPWTQLHDAIRDRIVEEELLPGDRLPAVRALAEDLGLAPNTVARAYRGLVRAGWLRGLGRAGTFVADRLPDASPEAELSRAARAYLRRAAELGFDRDAARRAL